MNPGAVGWKMGYVSDLACYCSFKPKQMKLCTNANKMQRLANATIFHCVYDELASFCGMKTEYFNQGNVLRYQLLKVVCFCPLDTACCFGTTLWLVWG